MSRSRYAAALAFAVVSAASGIAGAQEEKNIAEYVPEGEIKAVEDEKRQGWDGALQASATVNLVSNKSVVGQTDGFSMLFGLGLLSGLDYIYQRHEIRNTLNISQAWARTPVIEEFVKSDDVVSLESIYNYFLIDWAGAFARVNGTTSVFKTEAITSEPVDYAISDREGNVELREDLERLRLSDPFKPITLSESLGIFAEPVKTNPFNLSIRTGFGLRQTFANDVLVIQDDDTTEAQIEVQDITNPDSSLTVFQGGIEGFVGIFGKLRNDRVSYDLGVTALLPFLNNDPEDRSATELTRVGVAGTVAFAVFDWMSINYKLRILRDPQLLDDLQVQNNLLLTFNYTFVERSEPEAPPEPTEAEIAKEEAERRAAEAEARAAEAEARAAELEAQLAAPAPAPAPAEPAPAPTEPAPTTP